MNTRAVITRAVAVAALALGSAPAAAQEKPAGNDCQNVEPIAGSLQYRLAALALRGNAQTYGAAAVADDGLVSPLTRRRPEGDEDGDGLTAMVLGMNQTYGVLDVPTVEQNSGCPRALKYSYRPLDVAGVSFGLGYRSGDWGVFYASSVTYSFLAADNVPLRAMIGAASAIGSAYLVAAAPFIEFADREAGVVSFDADYVIGGMYDLGYVTAALGYMGSQGLYARLGGVDIGGFVSGVFNGEDGVAAIDLSFGPYDLGFGDPIIYGSRQAIIAPGITDAEGRTGRGAEAGAWSVAGAELRDIGGRFDVRATWMFEPEMTLNEVIAGWHTAGFHVPGEGLMGEDIPLDVRIFGGVLGRPTMRYYGVEGGVLGTGGVELRIGGAYGPQMRLVYNDPARLTLFPYAEGHVAFDYGIGGGF